MSVVKNFKPFGRLLKAALGFYYDFGRYARAGAWRADMSNSEVRSFHLVKIYHSLEKSLSFKNRNPTSGWGQARDLLKILEKVPGNERSGFHELRSAKVLREFCKHPHNVESESSIKVLNTLSALGFSENVEGGIHVLSHADFIKGSLDDPEKFFLSRYSLREFSPEIVDDGLMERALLLAQKTPSVCNRQTWHVYHTSDATVKRDALKFQSGNRGFGESIPNLVIVSADLRAFIPSNEHYQHWIDGGLYAMSLIYALHSLGVASCCLNWSQDPAHDKGIREKLKIDEHHSIIMMLAVGFPDVENQVCVSPRRPVGETFTTLVSR